MIKKISSQDALDWFFSRALSAAIAHGYIIFIFQIFLSWAFRVPIDLITLFLLYKFTKEPLTYGVVLVLLFGTATEQLNSTPMGLYLSAYALSLAVIYSLRESLSLVRIETWAFMIAGTHLYILFMNLLSEIIIKNDSNILHLGSFLLVCGTSISVLLGLIFSKMIVKTYETAI